MQPLRMRVRTIEANLYEGCAAACLQTTTAHLHVCATTRLRLQRLRALTACAHTHRLGGAHDLGTHLARRQAGVRARLALAECMQPARARSSAHRTALGRRK